MSIIMSACPMRAHADAHAIAHEPPDIYFRHCRRHSVTDDASAFRLRTPSCRRACHLTIAREFAGHYFRRRCRCRRASLMSAERHMPIRAMTPTPRTLRDTSARLYAAEIRLSDYAHGYCRARSMPFMLMPMIFRRACTRRYLQCTSLSFHFRPIFFATPIFLSIILFSPPPSRLRCRPRRF